MPGVEAETWPGVLDFAALAADVLGVDGVCGADAVVEDLLGVDAADEYPLELVCEG